MYYVKKTFEISAAHNLNLPYTSKCTNLHGHNYIITVYCKCKDSELTEYGMVIDFTKIKELVQDKWDHQYLNDLPPFDSKHFNPTAENMARCIVEVVPHCYRAEVEESKNNWACYEVDE